MKIDFTKLGIEKAFADLLKADFTKELKEYLRKNPDILGNNYLQIVKDDYTKPAQYSKEDQAEIDKFIAERGFKKIENPTIPNYSIELVATPLAKAEAERILKNAIANSSKRTQKNIERIAASKTKR